MLVRRSDNHWAALALHDFDPVRLNVRASHVLAESPLCL
jgi:hypothetical protein